jgi:hypothetical protein
MNTIESEFGFDEYIMPTTYGAIPKLESFDAQLYPSGKKKKKKKSNQMTSLTLSLYYSFWLLW